MAEDLIIAAANRARVAANELALANRAAKDAALEAMAAALLAHTDTIIAANKQDVERAENEGTPSALIDRLRLDADRVADMAQGLREVAGLPDPVGDIVQGSTLANGMQLQQVRVPFGVIAMIYEARPNVTADAAGICLKSGNAVLLRGSSSALSSNTAIVTVLREALANTDLPQDAVQLAPGEGRQATTELMRSRGYVDLLIPRGGAGLIASVVKNATVPIIETGIGNCHVYIDAAADLDKALPIVMNSKTHRCSVCNSAESLLVHADIAAEFLPVVLPALMEAGVGIYGDATVATYDGVKPASAEDWSTEYLTLDMSVGVVPDIDAAIDHIARHGTGHTEAIVTDSVVAARRFSTAVDAAVVMVNASTRFNDGGQMGFGAEIGISTQKLHARGPMGLTEMTSAKYIVTGDGHIR